MENKKIIIGLGVLAFAGIGYYMWKKNKPENTSSASGCDCGCGCCDDKEDVSNVTSVSDNAYQRCVNMYTSQGLSLSEAKAACSNARKVNTPLKYNEIKSNIISQNPFDKNAQVNNCINDQTLGYGVPFEEAVLMCGGVQSTGSVRPINNNVNKLVKK